MGKLSREKKERKRDIESGIKPEISEVYRIFQLEQKHNTKQNYKKAFKKANTRKTIKKYSGIKVV